MQQHNTALGQSGENQAIHFLISKNYLIKATNVLFVLGELDIVAFDPAHQELVFCEVKTRSSTSFGHPSAAITWKKRLAWKKAANLYLAQHPTTFDTRFDLISITPRGLEHFENIFI